MQPFYVFVPVLCAGFAYSAAVFVDFKNTGPLSNSRKIAVAGVGSDGSTTYVVEANNVYTGATATITSGSVVFTETATIVENGSGAHITISAAGVVEEDSCTWDSTSATATCIGVERSPQTTVTGTIVTALRIETLDATATTTLGTNAGPTTAAAGGGSSAASDSAPSASTNAGPTTTAAGGGSSAASDSAPSASTTAKNGSTTSIVPHYQWAIVILGSMAGAFFVW